MLGIFANMVAKIKTSLLLLLSDHKPCYNIISLIIILITCRKLQFMWNLDSCMHFIKLIFLYEINVNLIIKFKIIGKLFRINDVAGIMKPKLLDNLRR